MSWDVLILKVPAGATQMADLTDDDAGEPLGAGDDLRQRLTAEVPAADFTDPAHGFLDGGTWGVELHLGTAEPVDSIMLHVRGNGDGVIPVILRIAAATGGRALDVSSGRFIDRPDQTDSWHAFQHYRDLVTGH